MAIYLIVGQPRHGKSQFAVKKAYDYHQENLAIQKRIDSGKFDPEKDIVREIYSDIDGHADACDFVKPAPVDWRDVPHDSIIFMDEIHQRVEYCDTDGKMSQNPMIVDLTTHGHQNKDIILMTQDPERLNKGIRKLVEKLYLVKRPIQKPPFATIYEFERWLRDPWQAAASTRTVSYADSYKFFYKEKWQSMYKSASAHTSIKFKIQNKFIYAVIAIICLMSLSYVLFMKSGGDKLARNAISGLTGEQVQQQKMDSVQSVNQLDNAQAAFNPEQDCRKGINVEKPECVAWFKQLTETKGSVASGRNVQVSYNPNNPFDTEIQDQINYEVTAKPVFSGCMKQNGKYVAYTQQGTILNGVSQADCQRLVDHNDRPFDYFAKAQNQQRERSVPEQVQSNL